MIAKHKTSMLAAAWFLCQALEPARAADGLAWEAGEGYRRAKLKVPATGKTGFTLLIPEITGIRWTNKLSVERVLQRQNLMNGAGVTAADYDDDGRCDLYFCNKEGANALYRNLGNWRFEDVALAAGVTCTNQSSTGAVFADLNGDGRLDLLVTSFTGPNACFLNLGNGQFTNVTEAAGLISKGGTTSLALGDVDGDANLDLYVCYFGIEAILRDGGAYSFATVNGQPVATGRYAKRLKVINGKIYEYGEPDILYRNDGQAHFSPVKWEDAFRDEAGHPVSPPPDFGLAVQIRDIDGDGTPDIYVCNDFQTPDRVWLNDGTGHFKAIDRLALRNMSYASMGVDFGDLDRDGQLDFITVEMLSREHAHHLRQLSPMDPKPRLPGQIDNREEVARNALYWNRGDGTYAEIAYYSGVAASDWSWTPIFLDVDLDGYEDVLITNGHMFDVNDRDVLASLPPSAGQSQRTTRRNLLQYPRLETPNAAFRNRGDLTFEDAGDRWGFNSRQISHGMALADLDNDGDLDVVINCLNGAPLIYRNDSSAPRVAVRLKGKIPNPFGIGARIEVLGGPVPVQMQEMLCGGRYLSGDQALRVFAAGSLTNRLSIKVTWRNRTQSVVPNAEPNYLYEIEEAGAKLASRPPKPAVRPWFEDVSQLLTHKHYEEGFGDFDRQPLLPRKLSQLGPGVAWCDLDGDGYEDLIVGSGKGGKLAVYHNTGVGSFEPWSDPVWGQPASDDQTAVVGASLREGTVTLLVGSANYETAQSHNPAARQFAVQGKRAQPAAIVANDASSTGPMAVAEIDGAGPLSVFVGGRVIPGRYPEAASSRVFRLSANALLPDEENTRVLEKAGLVSGAVFSDLNGDGYPELILACEWGPVRVFQNDRGKLRDVTGELGMDKYTGLWSSVTTGDFDGDGRMDIVAGNWGLNSFYNLAPAGPWLLYYGDFNEDGQVNLLEAYPDSGLKKIVPWRDLEAVGKAMPWLRERFATHTAYSTASVSEILGERFPKAKELRAGTLATTLFFNRGDHFEAVALPAQAQWAPAAGVAVADMDGDGNEDVFLSQNFFAVRPEDDRLDAGRGLWLRGDGKGKLTPVAGQESGVIIYGEQRGAAVCDYDGDGRADLVVTQNGAETKLYHNAGARPGLRVSLTGRSGNPSGIGAQLRLIFGQRAGPVRELHAGSGYWSQDSTVQVLGTPEPPTQIWVRWPGGKTTTSLILTEVKEIQVDESGKVTVKR